MSVRVMSWLWEHSPARGSELLMLLALADYGDDAGRNAYPSVTSLARKCRLGERAAQKVVGRLTEKGWLVVEQEGGGRGRSNRYRLVLETPSAGPGNSKETPSANTPFPGAETPSVRSENPGRTDGGTVNNQKNPPNPPPAGGTRCKVHKRPKRWCADCQRPALAALPGWCGECDTPDTRMVETDDGKVTHCQRCHPKVVLAS